jgi:cbb3-type cytochrome oxidase subunit 1
MTQETTTLTQTDIGARWLQCAVVYLIIGVTMGIAMGATQDFTLRPVHAHVNLLGWATMALAGLIYSVYPQAGANKLGRAHFWLANISLPIMMVALSLVLTGNTAVVPALIIGELIAAAGVLTFAANVFFNLKRA